eukprot:5241604-Lingulodinium_polyedra.AAC.1
MVSTWSVRGQYMVSRWSMHGHTWLLFVTVIARSLRAMIITCPLHGQYRAIAWPLHGQCGHSTVITWSTHGHYMVIIGVMALSLHAHDMATIWPERGHYMAIAWPWHSH